MLGGTSVSAVPTMTRVGAVILLMAARLFHFSVHMNMRNRSAGSKWPATSG